MANYVPTNIYSNDENFGKIEEDLNQGINLPDFDLKYL